MSATSDELQAAINQLTFSAVNNAPATIAMYSKLRDVASQLSPGAPLTELTSVINQLRLTMPNNASVSFDIIDAVNDVYSQLTLGLSTTNPPDVMAIGQLEQAIIDQEPNWAPLLWINWSSSGTTLTVQVRGFYTLNMAISASPWWTNWPTYNDAASHVIAAIYLLQLSVAKFDQSSSSVDMTVSPDGLTATRTQMTTSFPGAARTSLSTFSRVAQVYVELKMHKLAPQDNGVGISNSAQELTNINGSYLGSPGNNSLGLYDNGQVSLNGAFVAIGTGWADGDIVAVGLDCLAKTVQFRNVSQNSSWFTPFDISVLGPAPYQLGITVYQVGESGTVNFTGPFVGTPLSGFGTWT